MKKMRSHVLMVTNLKMGNYSLSQNPSIKLEKPREGSGVNQAIFIIINSHDELWKERFVPRLCTIYFSFIFRPKK
jgi:hypothetical protein